MFANKAVFTTYGFKFVVFLTFIHTVFTWIGMNLFASLGFFTRKSIPQLKLLPLALGYIGYVVLCNVSLNLNSVGFYQIMKIAIAPTVVFLELLLFRKLPSRLILMSVALVCLGVALATVTDTVVIKNSLGLVAGVSATLVTAMYQIWVGSKQKELQANSSQLLQAYTPQAVVMMAVMVPMLEPIGNPAGSWGGRVGGHYVAGVPRGAGVVRGAQFGFDSLSLIPRMWPRDSVSCCWLTWDEPGKIPLTADHEGRGGVLGKHAHSALPTPSDLN